MTYWSTTFVEPHEISRLEYGVLNFGMVRIVEDNSKDWQLGLLCEAQVRKKGICLCELYEFGSPNKEILFYLHGCPVSDKAPLA